jgi:hypothetical protein
VKFSLDSPGAAKTCCFLPGLPANLDQQIGTLRVTGQEKTTAFIKTLTRGTAP